MTANRDMALRIVWGTRVDDDTPAADARELLAMCGLIQPDGHEILPDITGGTLVAPSAGKVPGRVDPSSSPLAQAESGRRPENCTTPPGLRDLPPTAMRPTPPAKKARRGLQAELDELERTDPDVAAAAASYDAMVAKMTSKPLPTPKSVPRKRVAVQPDQRKKDQPKPTEHGTPRGLAGHKRNNEPVPDDDSCGCSAARKEAQAAYQRAYWRRNHPLPDGASTELPTESAADLEPPVDAATDVGPTPEQIRDRVDGMAPRVHEDGSINAQHVAIEQTLRSRHGHPSYIADLDGPGNFRPAPVTVPRPVQVPELAPDSNTAGSTEPEPARPAAVDVKTWLARAQRSADPTVARAAGRAIALLVRVQAAGVQALADGRLTDRLTTALNAVTQAETRTTSRSNGVLR